MKEIRLRKEAKGFGIEYLKMCSKGRGKLEIHGKGKILGNRIGIV